MIDSDKMLIYINVDDSQMVALIVLQNGPSSVDMFITKLVIKLCTTVIDLVKKKMEPCLLFTMTQKQNF